MPNLADYQKSKLVKLMMIGNSGSGKTGSLVSLVRAGYKLRFLEFDQGLDALISHCEDEGLDISKIDFMSFRDKLKATPAGTKPDGPPKAFSKSLQALDTWEDGSDPSTWGDDTFLIVDSLTNVGRAAFLWSQAIDPTNRDPRRWYNNAQSSIEDMVANLTNEAFQTNVIIISHIEITENKDGTIKHYVSSIGKALGPKLPRFVNTLLLCESRVRGGSVQRQIHTIPTNMLDVKVPAPNKVEKSYDISDGMEKIVRVIRGRPHPNDK
ncbi:MULTISPECIES: AAA family ATPase [unclassified Roseobacter]|uniref:AAA family ATPase n=1 Tax=unclassified Roseobacter TaxID=196798 RepID=UPI001492A32D|nr:MULTISPECIES: AAA family ATPase [unclassified Roseobacter]NNW55488.1 AAA family ATPase [Roseobacter sp. HKCCD8284]NNY17325.1 AAA family ATPase [Roseobacter sp. HKCCD8191]